MKVLVTCPPMLRLMPRFTALFEKKGIELRCPEVVQTLSVPELKGLVAEADGWILGDDPATREVFAAGKAGRLRAAVKWGVGTDNVDFAAAKELGIPVVNTPGMFGGEVADMAVGYVIALARETFVVDRAVRQGRWPKPAGISLAGKTAALAGFGEIGRNIARRLLAADMRILAYDPFFKEAPGLDVTHVPRWPDRLEEADFVVLACALTAANRHMAGAEAFARMKPGARLVNVARGALVDERALEAALDSGRLHSAALDVFEEEPLPAQSPLRKHERCVFGSHNSSNTVDAVVRASRRSIELLFGLLGVPAA